MQCLVPAPALCHRLVESLTRNWILESFSLIGQRAIESFEAFCKNLPAGCKAPDAEIASASKVRVLFFDWNRSCFHDHRGYCSV